MKELHKEQWPGLPKWPAAYVTGRRVTEEQAKEIIFRTDTTLTAFSKYGFGNCHEFGKHLMETFGWLQFITAEEKQWFNRDAAGNLDEVATAQAKAEMERLIHPFENFWDFRQAWCDEMQVLSPEYVYNSWAASAYIYGPTGWCRPDGVIHFEGHNYGKWPDVSDIVADWELLAQAFPYLDIQCTLFNGESCDEHAEPVITILVKDQTVKTVHADLSLHVVDGAPKQKPTLDDAISRLMLDNLSREIGLPMSWYEEFGEKSRAAIAKVLERAANEHAHD